MGEDLPDGKFTFFPTLLLFLIVKGTLASDTSLFKCRFRSCLPCNLQYPLRRQKNGELEQFSISSHLCIDFLFYFFFTADWRKLRHFLLTVVHSGLKDRGHQFSQHSQRQVSII